MTDKNAKPASEFRTKIGKTPCEISYTTGIAVSPEEQTRKTTYTYKDSEGKRHHSIVRTQLQNFHLLKENGKEISVYTENESLNVREGHCLSLIRCKVKMKNKYEHFNMGFVNHNTDEIKFLTKHWSTVCTAPIIPGLMIFLASAYAFYILVQWPLALNLMFGSLIGIFFGGIVLDWFFNHGIKKFEKELRPYMEAIREYGNKHEFHKQPMPSNEFA